LSVLDEFERAMICDCVPAGLHLAQHVDGKRLGRPAITPIKIGRIRLALNEGRGIRVTADFGGSR
jgi:hypothetical protein